jgi:histidine triad (HIT) family protein
MTECAFCQIAGGTLGADIVYENEKLLAFLDNRPLFPGHVLLIPRTHYETLADVPGELAADLMLMTQRLARAVEAALQADGSFIAINNRVSQSVPHLHVHVVPRRRGDGLKGFFWPRHPYKDAAKKERILEALQREVRKLLHL